MKAEQPKVTLPIPIQLVTQIVISKALYTVVRAKVPDLLSQNGPMTVQQLGQKTQIKVEAMHRLMRSLEAFGMFSLDRTTKKWSNNQNTFCLVSGPQSVRTVILSFMNECYLGYTHLDKAVKEGCNQSPWQLYTGGKDHWQWMDEQEHKFERQNFNEMMVQNTRRNQFFIIQAYDWKSFSPNARVADIGGGKGHLVKNIYQMNNQITPIVYDLEKIIDEAKEWWKDSEIKAELIPGDFFKSVPSADVYILKHILHDWNDQKASQILKVVHQEAKKVPNCKLMIVQHIIDESVPLGHFGAFLDLQMLALVDGKERSKEQWQELLDSCGFQMEKITPAGELGIIEARVKS